MAHEPVNDLVIILHGQRGEELGFVLEKTVVGLTVKWDVAKRDTSYLEGIVHCPENIVLVYHMFGRPEICHQIEHSAHTPRQATSV